MQFRSYLDVRWFDSAGYREDIPIVGSRPRFAWSSLSHSKKDPTARFRMFSLRSRARKSMRMKSISIPCKLGNSSYTLNVANTPSSFVLSLALCLDILAISFLLLEDNFVPAASICLSSVSSSACMFRTASRSFLIRLGASAVNIH